MPTVSLRDLETRSPPHNDSVAQASNAPHTNELTSEGRAELVALRVEQLGPRAPNEPVIYWEVQGSDRMCALHCLNAIIQGPRFSVAELSAAAIKLDNAERALIQVSSSASDDLANLMAGGSSNASDDGFFSLAVIEQCLQAHNIVCIPKNNQLMRIRNEGHPDREAGYLCNHQQHWFGMRKLHGQWYDLDSLKAAPRKIEQHKVEEFLEYATKSGYSVFVVRSAYEEQGRRLPVANPTLFSRLNRYQFYLSDSQIDELARLDLEYHQEALQREAAVFGNGTSVVSGSAIQKKVGNIPTLQTTDTTSHSWPDESSGRKLSEAPREVATRALPSKESQTIPLQDDELSEAVRLSEEAFLQSLPALPPEPDLDDHADVISLRVRFKNGSQRVARRFLRDDTIETLFQWLERDPRSALLCQAPFELVSMYPKRSFQRTSKYNITVTEKTPTHDSQGAACTLVEDDIGQRKLAELFPSKQEMFILQAL